MRKLLFTILMMLPFIGIGQDNQEYLKYFNSGQSKFDSGDYYGAIYEYTKAIEVLDGFHPPSLTNRALAKAEIGDLDSAYDDINYVIEVVPEFGVTYYYRGLIKYQYSEDYYGAIADFLRAIEYDNKEGKYVYYLGLTKDKIGDANGACNDWKKAVRLGYQDAAEWVANECVNRFNASELLEKAYKKAKAENKNVFVKYNASWCGKCKKMDSKMKADSCKSMFENNYVFVSLIVKESAKNKYLETPGAIDFLKKHNGEGYGLPFWVVLNKNGDLLEDSFYIKGQNMGCPESEIEVAEFINILRKTSNITKEGLDVIAKEFLRSN